LDIEIEWRGNGVDEKGLDKKTGQPLIAVDPAYFRPAEVELLLGDSSKARDILGWSPKYDLKSLCQEMVAEDLKLAQKEKLLKDAGMESPAPSEMTSV
jgi:GDPmannose 4,6-dehydratase